MSPSFLHIGLGVFAMRAADCFLGLPDDTHFAGSVALLMWFACSMCLIWKARV